MALIKCPECGKEVSDLAKRCPNCGFRIERKGKKSSPSKLLFIVSSIIILVIAGVFISRLHNIKQIDIVPENLPDTGITVEEIRRSLLDGNEDTDMILKYIDNVFPRLGDIIAGYEEAITDEDTNILELEEQKIELLEELKKYKKANSLLLKRQTQIDEWALKLVAQYYRQYILAYDNNEKISILAKVLEGV